jgi:hypothetical protein
MRTQVVRRFYNFKRYVNSAEGVQRLQYQWKTKPEGLGKRDGIAASVPQWLACWPLVPEFAGSNPAEAVGFSQSTIHEGEVKPSVPCRNFAACKRSVHLPWKSQVVRKIKSAISSPILPSFAKRGLSRRWTWSASGDDGGH